ncbi:MAG: glycosyltransferase family 4 protein, partial [bacterium]
MKIFIISNAPRSLYRFRGKLIKELIHLGHEVHALTPIGESEDNISKIRSTASQVHEYYLNRTGVSLYQDFKTLISLIRLMRSIRPDMVFSYTIKPVIYGSIAASIARVPKVFSLINGTGFSFSDDGKSKIFLHFLIKRLFSISLKRNKFVFFQNKDDRDLFIQNNLVKAKLSGITNGSGVDLKEFNFHPMNKGNVIKFLYIGRFFKQKGINLFVEAAKIIKNKYGISVEFQLIGRIGNDKNSVKKDELESWEKKGLVKNLGFVEDVKSIIVNSHVVVLPSYYREGVPRSLLEALAIGRAIITTNSIGCKETVKDGENGLLIEPNNLHALIEAIEVLINNSNLLEEMGKKSRILAEHKFDVDVINKYMLGKMNLV